MESKLWDVEFVINLKTLAKDIDEAYEKAIGIVKNENDENYWGCKWFRHVRRIDQGIIQDRNP